MTSPRLTPVQRDVLERMKNGWTLAMLLGVSGAELRKSGEPARHVSEITVDSLIGRRLIRNNGDFTWVLAQ